MELMLDISPLDSMLPVWPCGGTPGVGDGKKISLVKKSLSKKLPIGNWHLEGELNTFVCVSFM